MGGGGLLKAPMEAVSCLISPFNLLLTTSCYPSQLRANHRKPVVP